MPYLLGIDLGSTVLTAAVLRPGGQPCPVRLDDGTVPYALPAILVATPAGELLCGEQARRRAASEPDRVARGFLHRVGDPTPLDLGGARYRAEDLCARLVRVVVDEVVARHGAPGRIAVTHPAGWGRHKRDLLAGALARHGVSASLVAAPRAVGLVHRSAAPDTRPLAVVDLGGSGAVASVLAPAPPGVLPTPLGRDVTCRTGGADVDDAVFELVRAGDPAVAATVDALDPDDPQALAALTALREDCRTAKEVLSTRTETALPVRLPGLRTSVRLHRGDLDELAAPVLEPVADLVAGLLADHPDAEVLLCGGTARMPVAVQVLSAGTGRAVVVAADPVHDAACGAALSVAPGTPALPTAPGSPAVSTAPGSPAVSMAVPTAPGTGPLALHGRVPAPRGAEDARTARVPATVGGPAGSPWAVPSAAASTAVPPTRVPAAAWLPDVTREPPGGSAPGRPVPESLVTRDVSRPGARPFRNRILVGAGGLAGLVAVTGALLFWPTSPAGLGELSAAPVLPDNSATPAGAPAPVPVVPAGPAPASSSPGAPAAAGEPVRPGPGTPVRAPGSQGPAVTTAPPVPGAPVPVRPAPDGPSPVRSDPSSPSPSAEPGGASKEPVESSPETTTPQTSTVGSTTAVPPPV